MIFKSQRELADNASEKIKETIKLSALDYLWQESAYSVTIKLRKKFLNNYSDKQTSTPPPASPATPFRDLYSFPPPPIKQDQIHKQLQDVRQELVQTILANSHKVKTLEENLDEKQSVILKLERKLEESHEKNESALLNLDESLKDLQQKLSMSDIANKDIKKMGDKK